ncbi:MAG: ATP phosphoribosyltransferase [Bacillota bacterium]|nr:ATP phosphoribosyltransferase [Bacillota bacterium]
MRIAIAKGRVLDEVENVTQLLLYVKDDRSLSRASNLVDLECLIVKPWDVPLYVAAGIVELGIVGNDVLRERNLDTVELLDLRLAPCRLVLAGLSERVAVRNLRVATKYPILARELLEKRGIIPQLFQLQGSVELAPLVGLADAIVDIVQTGVTLRDNGLTVWEELMSVSARLVVNPAAWRLNRKEVERIIMYLEAHK